MWEIEKIHDLEETNYQNMRLYLGDALRQEQALFALYDRIDNQIAANTKRHTSERERLVIITRSCGYYLTSGTLTLMRGHADDSLLHLRKAVEYAGVVYRSQTGDASLLEFWEAAEQSNKKSAQYQERTKSDTILPTSNPLTKKLKTAYKRCCEIVHSSKRSVQGRVQKIGETQWYWYFDIGAGQQVFLDVFMLQMEMHLTIIRLFASVFESDLVNVKNEFEVQLKTASQMHDYWQQRTDERKAELKSSVVA